MIVSASGGRDAAVPIDLDPLHARQVDIETVVDRAVPGQDVSTASYRDLEVVSAGESHRFGHIGVLEQRGTTGVSGP